MTDGFALKSWVVNLVNKVTKKAVNNKYSTNETRVGTWIDGKPIYRRVVKVENPNLHAGTPLTEANVDTLVNAVIYMNRIPSSPNTYQIYGYYAGNNDYCTPYIVVENNTIKLVNEAAGGAYSIIAKAIVTIEYTKTTDKATS